MEKEKLLQRLKRIEGQVRGVQRMIGEEQECVDILVQIAAVRGALDQVGLAVFEHHSQRCILEALDEEKNPEAMEELMSALKRFLK